MISNNKSFVPFQDGTYNARAPTCEPATTAGGALNNAAEKPAVYTPTRLPDPVTEESSSEKNIVRKKAPYAPRRPYLKKKLANQNQERDELEAERDEIRIPYRKIKKKVCCCF